MTIMALAEGIVNEYAQYSDIFASAIHRNYFVFRIPSR